MKKIYTCSLIIMSLCLFIACTSDNDDEGDKERTSQNNGGNNNNNNPTPQKPSKIKKICVGTISAQSAYGAYSLVFNENGSLTNCYNNGRGNGSVRLEKIRTDSVFLSYRIAGFKNSMDEAIKLNSQGLCEKNLIGYFTSYNSDGYLTSETYPLIQTSTSNNTTIKYEYKNGDLVSTNFTNKNKSSVTTYTEKYTSSSELNDADVDLNFFFWNDNASRELLRLYGLLGKKSKHIFSQIRYNSGNEVKSVNDVDVTRNFMGKIINIKYTMQTPGTKKNTTNEVRRIINIQYDNANDAFIAGKSSEGNGRLVSKIVFNQNDGQYRSTYWLSYDTSDRVTYLKHDNYERYSDNSSRVETKEYFYEYTGNKVIFTWKKEDNSWTDVYVLDNHGHISEYCTYTKGGSILTSTVDSHLYDFSEYLKINDTTGEGKNQKTKMVVYWVPSKEANDANLDLNALFIPGYLFQLPLAKLIGLVGTNDQYILSTVKVNNMETKINKVTRDSKGKISKIEGTYQKSNWTIDVTY